MKSKGLKDMERLELQAFLSRMYLSSCGSREEWRRSGQLRVNYKWGSRMPLVKGSYFKDASRERRRSEMDGAEKLI